MSFKKVMLFIHRWLGFISGLVVFIVSITGCIFCFQDEIQDAIHNYRKVAVEHKPYLAPSELKAIALKNRPGATSNYMYYYGVGRPANVLVSIPNKELTYVFLNPYTGQVLHTEGIKEDFFIVVEYIHLYLLLPTKIGQVVVGVSVIIFVVLMITGVILWWPKRKVDRKRSFTIKWGARWRRVNYDLHNVLGFYALSIAILLALTGLSMTFEWVNKGIYNTFNLGKKYAYEQSNPQSDTLNKISMNVMPVIDRALLIAKSKSPDAEMFLIADADTKAATIGVTAYRKSLHFGLSDFYFFDRYTGKLLKYLPNSKKSLGMQVSDLNYDLHVGQALGMPGKILAFLASLICASLPVTGFIVWIGKRKKSKPGKEKQSIHRRNHKLLMRVQ